MAKVTTNRGKTSDTTQAENLGFTPLHLHRAWDYRNDIRVGRSPDGPAAAQEVSRLSKPLFHV